MFDIINEYIKDGSYVSKLGNISSICMEYIDDLNWVGFYLYNKDEDALVLDAFSGKKATSIIKPTDGVCGHCYSIKEVVVVDDVHNFCGHIACDLNSRSELVLPIIKDNEVIGVMDIDSPIKSRFTNKEVEIFSEIVNIIIKENIL